MSANLGFGKPPSQPKVSKRSIARTEASSQYDRMKGDGVPEFEIYIRIRGKKQWYPVGAIAVKRSSQIDRAIFDSERELLQGAFRLFPILRKNQQQLEYGYRLKEYKDEPIQLAKPPQTAGSRGFFTQIKDRVASLLKR